MAVIQKWKWKSRDMIVDIEQTKDYKARVWGELSTWVLWRPRTVSNKVVR